MCKRRNKSKPSYTYTFYDPYAPIVLSRKAARRMERAIKKSEKAKPPPVDPNITFHEPRGEEIQRLFGGNNENK